MKEHKEYTKKLNDKVIELENEDVKQGNAFVKTRDKAKEKVANDERNHVASGIFMNAEIKKAINDRKKFQEVAETAEARAQVKVQQAQNDVTAKNEVIAGKDKDINRLEEQVKAEEARAEHECSARIGRQSEEYRKKEEQLTKIKDDEIAQAKEATRKAEDAAKDE